MLARFVGSCALGAMLGIGALTAPASGDSPYPYFSTCTISITQFPPRPACIDNFDPDVIRLTPNGSTASPVFDRASITVRVRDALGDPLPNVLITMSEQSGWVNIANGGSTTAITDATGLASVSIHAASGYGRVALCADGLQLCNLNVRSPDVTKTSVPTLCGLGTAASSVSGNDINNPTCGFLVHFGPVTIGVNDGFDLNCDMNVSGPDINGSLGKGGVLQYFGDVGTLGSQNTCALP